MRMAAIFGYAEPLRILCTREFQDSIKESSYAELKAAIKSIPWLAAHYDIGESFIRGKNGTEFIFKGLRHNISSIKSMANIDIAIVEEAEDVPEKSWIDFEPTIRAPGSEIWVMWNPRTEGSPVDTRFRKQPPPRAVITELDYRHNPWFPRELEEQRLHQRQVMDPDTYAHIWEGAYLKQSKASIFYGKWRVEAFEASRDWDGPYFGGDFGFSTDPCAGVKLWIHDEVLYVEYDSGGVGIEIDALAETWRQGLPGVELHEMRADNARPESISYLQRHGLPRIVPCTKGKGSVEDGIAHIKSFREVIIHPRCSNTAHEFRTYSYKVDRLSGQVMTDIVDADNHYIDAIRYALEPVRTAGWSIFG